MRDGKAIPLWFSEEVCKAVTGAGNSKRKLYTDDNDIAYKYRRCIVLNGINNSLSEPDALDRCLILELQRITNEERKTDEEVTSFLQKKMPELLGYIFDTIGKALGSKSSIKLSRKPRMADFAVWGEAIARCMGYKEGEFLTAYTENISHKNADVLESNPLAQAVQLLAADLKVGEAIEDSPEDILKMLKERAATAGIDVEQHDFPKHPGTLSKRLKPISHNIRDHCGIDVIIDRHKHGAKKGYSVIRIVKIPPLPPPSSQ